YREKLRYPENLPATVASHFHFLWATDAGSDRDPNLIVQEFVWGRWADLLPEVPAVNDLSWLPDAHRPTGYGQPRVGIYYSRLTPENARWWKPGALVFGGPDWDRSPVDYSYADKHAESVANVRKNIEFMASRVQWMTIDGERCCAWQQCLEGEAIDIFDGGVPTVHNIQTWQMALLFLDAYRNDPQTYGQYLEIVDGVVRWTKHVLYTRNGYHDVPAAQFCWGAAPSTVFCLRYYYTFRNDPQRRELAEMAYRLARNMMYHYLPTWLADNDEMDELDAFSYCEPNSGISWLGSACSNEVWCVPFAATVTYLATGDPWLGHYVCGAVERWHELFRDEWYPTVRQYGDAFSEEYYLYPGRGPLGGRVTFGGLWGLLEQIAWPIGEASVRITCGEKAALSWNKAPGGPPVDIEEGRLVRRGSPNPSRAGRHTNIDEYRYYGDGNFSFRLTRYGLGQPEPFTINVTFPMFDLRGKPVARIRDGQRQELAKGRDYEEMPNRWDTIVVRDCRYGDVIAVGKYDPSVSVLPCQVARVRQAKPSVPVPEHFAVLDLRQAANRVLSFDWEDPDSWAGLEFGRRWIYGVPFDIIDADFNEGRVGLRDKRVEVSLPARHVFALVGEVEDGARITLTCADGKTTSIDPATAVPALRGWPPCFEWTIGFVHAPVAADIAAVEARGCTLFALTSMRKEDKARLAAIVDAIRAKEQQVAMENATSAAIKKLGPALEKFSGRIAFLPLPGGKTARGSTIAKALHKAGLVKHVVFLTPQQLVDPNFFKPSRFAITIYAGGEAYIQSVTRPGDADEALQRYLARGGTLLVLAEEPFPFYYNESHKTVVNASKFGLPICPSGEQLQAAGLKNVRAGGWEQAPRDRKLTFSLNPDQKIVTSIPASFPFPYRSQERPAVDERWRPIVNVIGGTGRYTSIISLSDDAGNSYGDGAAVIDYTQGPLAPGRVIYVWTTLLRLPEIQSNLLSDLLGWVLSNTLPPPSDGLCYYTHDAITVDGRLDEPVWQRLPAIQLHKVINGEGSPDQPTEVKAAWDGRYLYVAFTCKDTDAWATMKNRDDHLWEEEVVEVFVDPDGDGTQYKEFEVNPLGTVVDLNIARPAHGDLAGALAWNSDGWQTAVRVAGTADNRNDTDQGWVCEMAIPLADIAAPRSLPRPGDTWRVNFYRIDRPNKTDPNAGVEFSAWSAVLKGYHEPERFGFLTFAADPFADDFSLHKDGEAPGPPWAAIGGTWAVQSGELIGQDGGTDGWLPAGLIGGLPTLRDYTLSVRFRVDSRGSDWRDGPWFGVRCRPDSGYFVEFTQRSVQLHKAVAGRTTTDEAPLAERPFTLSDGWHRLEVTVAGTSEVTLSVSLDGQALIEAKDKNVLGAGPVEEGGIVLCPRRWSRATGHTIVRFDDVVITAR
ncbi:MAG: carbohydrate-binding family 9-like protein, partial [Armatimonadetes bacterium]|nr:carbohydrate-binding family 9-like protein [Armatimonadota bacterium]